MINDTKTYYVKNTNIHKNNHYCYLKIQLKIVPKGFLNVLWLKKTVTLFNMFAFALLINDNDHEYTVFQLILHILEYNNWKYTSM